MPSVPLRSCFAGLILSATLLPAQSLKLEAVERLPDPVVDPASDDALRALQRFSLPAGFKAQLWAAEPMLANPVAFDIDAQGRIYVAETYRYRTSVLDIRHYMGMVELDLAARTIEDRVAMTRQVFGEEGARQLAIESELVRMVEDRDGDGKADRSHVFATGFNSMLDGIASGVLARKGEVWFTNIPSLWRLERDASGAKATKREEVLRGFGVRFNYTGHDFHGLAIGPDGKLYFTIGDRGTHARGREGQVIDVPDEGAIFRANLDGSDFELVARGLRNPQELAFDEHGNLFTGDNDSDNGDMERLVHVVEGSDSGWRVGYQHAPLGQGGPWMTEGLWKMRFPEQPAYLLPPVSLIEDGPSGLTYHPGTGLGGALRGHFFICHFKGSISRSGIQTYAVRPQGAGFVVTSSEPFMGGILATDVSFGPDGDLYALDWVEGWPKSRKGRIYRVAATTADPAQAALSAEVRTLLAKGFEQSTAEALRGLLAHADYRVRLEAQLELADRGPASLPVLTSVAQDVTLGRLARLHAIWGLGQLGRAGANVADTLVALAADADEEVRAQCLKVLGDLRLPGALPFLVSRLEDAAPRVSFFAAQALGKLTRPEAADALVALARRNADQDATLRHAVVIALSQLGATPALEKAAQDPDRAVRLTALLVYRRLQDAAIASFLDDADPFLVREAALAINDAPVVPAYPALAAKLATAPAADEPLVLRAINAALRSGGREHAEALVAFAGRADAPEAYRREALVQLAAWARVPERDRLVGVYRPLPPRDAGPAVQALAPAFATLAGTGPESVRLAAIDAGVALRAPSAGDALQAVVADETAPGAVRGRALTALETLGHPGLASALQAATRGAAVEPRLAALQILARRDPGEALPIIAQLAGNGNEVEQQAAYRALAQLDMALASKELISALDRLRDGKVAAGAQFDLLDAVEKSTDAGVQARWQQVKQAWASSGDALAPFRGALQGGAPHRGRSLFNNHPVLACIRCHKVNGEGGEAGPDLTTIGARKSPDYILEAILNPNAQIAEGFDLVSVGFGKDQWEAGTIVRETPTELVLRRGDGSEVALDPRTIKERSSVPSSMPAIYGQVMSRTELRDLLAYVTGLTVADPSFKAAPPRATGGTSAEAKNGGHD